MTDRPFVPTRRPAKEVAPSAAFNPTAAVDVLHSDIDRLGRMVTRLLVVCASVLAVLLVMGTVWLAWSPTWRTKVTNPEVAVTSQPPRSHHRDGILAYAARSDGSHHVPLLNDDDELVCFLSPNSPMAIEANNLTISVDMAELALVIRPTDEVDTSFVGSITAGHAYAHAHHAVNSTSAAYARGAARSLTFQIHAPDATAGGDGVVAIQVAFGASGPFETMEVLDPVPANPHVVYKHLEDATFTHYRLKFLQEGDYQATVVARR
jgi:hypothetical protein